MQSGGYPPQGGQPQGTPPQPGYGYGPPIPSPTGGPQGYNGPDYMGPNTSGQGANAVIPPEVEQMGFNWGAFLMNWIWGIGNQTWIALITLIPCIGFFAAIWLGINGNKLAWRNRRFESVAQFKAVQAAWTKWGIILIVASILLNFVFVLLGGRLAATAPSSMTTTTTTSP